MINIISWNIRQGGGSRVSEISNYLVKQNAHVIVLSEFRNNDAGIVIRKKLLNAGFIHQVSSPCDATKNGVLICSMFPFSSQVYFDIDPKFSHCMIKATFEAFDLYGVYMPHKKKHKLFTYLNMQDFSESSIIAGDFNSGINHLDQKGDSFWYEDDLLALQKKGFIDAFRSLHGELREYSWYSHQGNGYRYDHSYISNDLKGLLKACTYDHDARVNKLSDHSPMKLVLA